MFWHSPHSLAGFLLRFMFPRLGIWAQPATIEGFHSCGSLTAVAFAYVSCCSAFAVDPMVGSSSCREVMNDGSTTVVNPQVFLLHTRVSQDHLSKDVVRV